MRSFYFLLIVWPLLFVAACGGGDAGGPAPESRVDVEDFQFAQLPGGTRIVMGKLHNLGAEAIRNAQIQISLYDADNRLVTTMSIIVRNVEPGEHKPFREPIDADENVRGARVRSVLLM